MRPIDADSLKVVPNVRKVTEYDETGCGLDYLAIPVDVIEDAPTLDVAPVVRCKDCKYWLRGHDRVWLRNHSRMCSANGFMTAPIFYCALGAKMEGGNNE